MALDAKGVMDGGVNREDALGTGIFFILFGLGQAA